MSSKLQICSEALMEACWLAAAAIIPLYFNISSVQMFEPDKVFVLRLLAVLAAAAFLLKRVDRRVSGPARPGDPEPAPALLKRPLLLSVLILAAIYMFSSALSIMPIQSWWGTYIRAQGAITFCCYVVLFLVVLTELRTATQLRRLHYAIILTSVPVAAYTILQFADFDPIPWRDMFHERSMGTMGNPIFLGGYLVMVIPLTFSRMVDAVQTARSGGQTRPGLVLAACSGAALMMQMLALLFTQSRGPILGLALSVYVCVFLFLVLKRIPGKSGSLLPALAAVLGFAAPFLAILVARAASKLSAVMAWAGLGATVLLVAVLYLVLWRASRWRNWLWLAYIAQTAAIGIIVAAGPTRLMGLNVKALPEFNRLAGLSDGSVSVRQLLWKTGFDAIRSGAPRDLPDGTQDRFHYLRPAVGYGPESIIFPAYLYGVRELVLLSSGRADRMHNEVFDSLLTVGIAGTAFYLFIVAAAFFHALRYLGLIGEGRRKTLFFMFQALGILSGILLPWLAGMPQMAGLGIQAGLVLALFAWIVWAGFRSRGTTVPAGPRQVLVLCILGALIAHFMETAFCIAVTPTRLYFFLLLAVLSVLVSGSIKEEEVLKQRAARSLPSIVQSLFPYIAIASFLVLVEAWSFIVNTTIERSAWALYVRTWFVSANGPVCLILLVLTLCIGIGLMVAEKPDPRQAKGLFARAAKVFLGTAILVWLAVGLYAATLWAALDPAVSSPMQESLHAESRVTLLLFSVLLLLALAAWVLVSASLRRFEAAAGFRLLPCGIGILLAIGAGIVIFKVTVRPARADVACHIARVYEKSGEHGKARLLFERAVQLAPDVASYHVSLGLSRSRAGTAKDKDPAGAFESLQRAVEINPLDPESYITLATLFLRSAEEASDPAIRDVQIHRAIPYLERATRLAPNQIQAHNELGRCYVLLKEYAKAEVCFDKATRISRRNPKTFLYRGEMYYRQNNLELALQQYTGAIRRGGGAEAARNAGMLLALMGRREEAILLELEALKRDDSDFQLLRHVAILYFSVGNEEAGRVYADLAYRVSPAGSRGSFRMFQTVLENQANQLLEETKGLKPNR